MKKSILERVHAVDFMPQVPSFSSLYTGGPCFSKTQLEVLHDISNGVGLHLLVPSEYLKVIRKSEWADILVLVTAVVVIFGVIGFIFLFSNRFDGSFGNGSAISESVDIPNITGVPTLDLMAYYDTYINEQGSILNEIEAEFVANPRSTIEPTHFLLNNSHISIVLSLLFMFLFCYLFWKQRTFKNLSYKKNKKWICR